MTEPVTRARIRADLAALGVAQGDVLLVHGALSSLGWVVGGAKTVIEALLDAVGPAGILAMPSFTGDLNDPAGWSDPPVPAHWIETVRAEIAPFDPARTPTRDMGRVAELFRTWPGVRRSDHPECSIAVWGADAPEITRDHALAFGLGDATPIARLYDRDAKVLLLGVGHDRNSSLHLAESRAANGRRVRKRYPVRHAGGASGEGSGRARWVEVEDVADDGGELFPEIGAAFEAAGAATIGRVARAEARLMRQRALVDFAAAWLDERLAAR